MCHALPKVDGPESLFVPVTFNYWFTMIRVIRVSMYLSAYLVLEQYQITRSML